MYSSVKFCNSIIRGLCHTSSELRCVHSWYNKTSGSCLLLPKYLPSHTANCRHVNGPFWGACQMPFNRVHKPCWPRALSHKQECHDTWAQQQHLLLDLTFSHQPPKRLSGFHFLQNLPQQIQNGNQKSLKCAHMVVTEACPAHSGTPSKRICHKAPPPKIPPSLMFVYYFNSILF